MPTYQTKRGRKLTYEEYLELQFGKEEPEQVEGDTPQTDDDTESEVD